MLVRQSKLALWCAAFALLPGRAFAVGVDFSTVACPGNAGATAYATMDCAAGGSLILLVTFQPNEAISDLVEVDADVCLHTRTDFETSATFWNFTAGGDLAAVHASPARPAAGCGGYSAGGWTTSFVSPGVIQPPWGLHFTAGSVSAGGFSVVANQKIFAMQLIIDASSSVEAGGTMTGCALPVDLAVMELDLRRASGGSGTPLTAGSLTGGAVMLNGADVSDCKGDLPVHRNTWGQLKSLYR
jgi:hypothetical protein